MGSLKRFALTQSEETPITWAGDGAFKYRFTGQRSNECRASGEPGQDFLAVCSDDQRLVFALCDGVGQSFYGDWAARYLGNALVDWMWQQPGQTDQAARLAQYLTALVEPATSAVKALAFPDGIAPMVVTVLKKKRSMGSESTFITGLLDTDAGAAHFYWMGDSRLRVWNGFGLEKTDWGDVFRTPERWSSRKGLVGGLHNLSLPLDQARHFVAYSDGLRLLDEHLAKSSPMDERLTHWMNASAAMADSDDTSLLEVWVGQSPILSAGLRAPQGVLVEPAEDGITVMWLPLMGVATYDVEVALLRGEYRRFSIRRTRLQLNLNQLQLEVKAVRVRGVDRTEPGDWSTWKELKMTGHSANN